MSALCPCCGGEVSPLDLLVDRDTGRIVYAGADARLSAQEMRLFAALLDAYPRVLTKADLVTAVAGDPLNEPDDPIINVLVLRVRRKLDSLGLSVANIWGIGYRLELSKDERSAVERERRFREANRSRSSFAAGDVAAVAMLRAQGLPITAVAQRLGLTFAAVMAAIDAMEAEKRAVRATPIEARA